MPPRAHLGPKKTSLGWTVSEQVCLDRVRGPVHISTSPHDTHTAVQPVPTTLASKILCHADEETKRVLESLSRLQIVACSNYFEVDDKVEGVANEIKNDIYRTTPEDNDVSMSWDDHQFIQIMEEGIYKNEAGNWVMPLPFRS